MSFNKVVFDQFLADLKHIVAGLQALIKSRMDAQQPAPTVIEQPAPPQPPLTPITATQLTLEDIIASHPIGWCAGSNKERKAMYDLARQIAKEEGLSLALTSEMLGTIFGESGFNQYCVNQKTKDYGVAQFSHKYYLVEYNMSPLQALTQPDKCLRIMARNFSNGRASNWVAHQNWQGNFNTLQTWLASLS